MSNPSLTSSPRTPVTPLTGTNGTGYAAQSSAQAKSALVPTNNVSCTNGVTVRARIDPTLTVNDVIKQLCVNLKIQGSPLDYALRDDDDELVTNDNLRKKIKAKVHLQCVFSFFHPGGILNNTTWKLVLATHRDVKDAILP